MQLPFISALFHIAYTAFGTNNFYGIDISSFTADGQCRDAGMFVDPDTVIRSEGDSLQSLDQWDAIVSNAKNNGYQRFRIYGNDCGTYGAVFGLGVSINISWHRNYFRSCYRFC